MKKITMPGDAPEGPDAELDRRLRDYWTALGAGEAPARLAELAAEFERARRAAEGATPGNGPESGSEDTSRRAAGHAAAAPFAPSRRRSN